MQSNSDMALDMALRFEPAWWCPGPHLQTVWRWSFGERPLLPIRRERWETPDDDFLDLDFADPAGLIEGEGGIGSAVPTVLSLHGLEGSSRAKYILGMLREANRLGWRGVALNFRSCSGEINRQRRFYHSGETTDLDWVVRRLIDRFPGSPLFLIGFSLGGNVLLKWLGEQGERAPEPVRAAVAVSVPFDLAVSARAVDRGVSRIYGQVFLKTLKKKASIKARRYPGLVDPARIGRITSFAEFDDQVTAPIHGFRDGVDYWTSSSSKKFLDAIRRPVLLINARNDPFLPAESLPVKMVEQSEWLTADFPPSGGHVGFVEGPFPWSVSYWSEKRAMAFLSFQISGRVAETADFRR
ncbi:MAG: alpha/beta fold hydrolase [Candidatus Manganitrophaceae bacterium]